MCLKITEKITFFPSKTVIETRSTKVCIIKLFEKNKQRLRLFCIDIYKRENSFEAEEARNFTKYDRFWFPRKNMHILDDYLVPAHFEKFRMTNFLLKVREFIFM